MSRQRQDWENRTPRWRCSLTQDRVQRVIHALSLAADWEIYSVDDEEYNALLQEDMEYFQKVSEQFDRMLPDHEYPLLDEDWLVE